MATFYTTLNNVFLKSYVETHSHIECENAHLELKNFLQKYVRLQTEGNYFYFVYRVEKHEKDVQFKLS